MKARYEKTFEDVSGPFEGTLSARYVIPFVKKNPDKTGVNGIDALTSYYESSLRQQGISVRSMESRETATGIQTTLHLDFRPERKNWATVSVDASKRESAISIVGSDSYDILKIATEEFLDR